MKKYALLLTSLTIVMLLSETDLSNDFLLFLLVGAIPGTNYNLSSTTMLWLIVVTSWVVVFRFTMLRTLAKRVAILAWKYLVEAKERFMKRPLVS